MWEELGYPNSSVNMPMERFRFHAGLCSWTERKKTLIIKAGLKKLYGDKLQNNSVKTFGRDLTTKEINEIKKGDNAVFPIVGQVVTATRKKRGSTGAARVTRLKSNSEERKVQSRKRKHSTEDEEEMSSEEDSVAQVPSRKRARHGRRGNSIAAELNDLAMFEQTATIIDQDDATRRYSLRPTRKDAKRPSRTETIEEQVERSTDEEYEDAPTPTQRYSSIKTWKVGKGHINNDGVESPSRDCPSETDEEERPSPRVPFGRIPQADEVGGKNNGPSRVALVEEEDESSEEKDYRQRAVPLNINGSIHYATFAGLMSNEPPRGFSGYGIVPQRRTLEVNGASLTHNQSYSPQSHAFNGMMNTQLFEQDLEEENRPLQAHRKRVGDFLGDEQAEAHAPPSKRLRTEQSVLLPIIPPETDHSTRALRISYGRPLPTRQQKFEAEWGQVFEQMFTDVGFHSINYSEVSPWNEEEVHSLIDALLPTREVYSAWTGEPAPRTDPQQSYRAQFDTIFGAFQDWWRANRPNETLPILAGVMHFGRAVDDWESPSKDSIYYEAFERGHQAPRDEKGHIADLPDWPGSRLEDAFRRGQ